MPSPDELFIDEIVKSILKKDIGLNENIFEYGANSLTAIQIVSEINQKLGRNITIKDFFEKPTKNTLLNSQ
ncbi:acyl carrier protein [Azospirillum sp. B510]|uniref:acyl carrier protein n=1 Tax=Azospirillum sp. (strain B510) TaxID=137722 RepID=UPI000B34A572|nr:acyl carrier protein [Azospirillum sp. B510]